MKTPKERETASFEEVSKIFSYNKETGDFRWKISLSDKTHIGQIAGTQTPAGYIRITFNGQKFQAHRLAWLLVHGKWPDGVIDHKNGVRTVKRRIGITQWFVGTVR